MEKRGKHGSRRQVRKKGVSPESPLAAYESRTAYLASRRKERKKLLVKQQNERLLNSYYFMLSMCRIHIAEPWLDTPSPLRGEARNLDDIRNAFFRQHVEVAEKLKRFPSGTNKQAQWEFLARALAGFDFGYSPGTSEQKVRELFRKKGRAN